MSDSLTHIDASGAAHMVDVADKDHTTRVAIAESFIKMQQATLDLIVSGDAKKGDVLGVARIAGIMASKRTHELIPLCHPLALTKVQVDLEVDQSLPGLRIEAMAKVNGQTGVEMEALTPVQVSLLTIYDMCKAVDRGMVMGNTRLLHKAGGKSGEWSAD